MPRPEKVQAVADIKERFEGSVAVFMAEYAGLSVAEQQQLRRSLRAAGGEFRVVKMTLARLAASELGHEAMLGELTGPTGLAFAGEDSVAAAKVLKDFAKDHAKLVIKGGLLGGETLSAERVSALADLDSKEVLLAKIAGAFQAPMAGMANLLAAMPRNMATMLQQLIDKTPADADVPAAPAEEPVAEVEAAVEAVEETVEESTADESTEASDDTDTATTDDEPAVPAEEE